MITITDLVEIKLHSPDDFLVIKETLQRIGISSKKEKNTLYQSCHILHKKGKYYITHFKEMFGLDGKTTTFDENDKARRNTIIKLLEQWGLLTVVDPKLVKEPILPISQIKIVKFSEKKNWTFVQKYQVGKKELPYINK